MPGVRPLLLTITLGLLLAGCGMSEGNDPDPNPRDGITEIEDGPAPTTPENPADSNDPSEPDVPDEPSDDEGNEADEHSPAIAVALLAEVNSARTSGVSCGGD